MRRPYLCRIAAHAYPSPIAAPAPDLYAATPGERLAAARALSPRAAARLRKKISSWPPHSPAAANAWVVLFTSRSPDWREPLIRFPADTPTLGEPHPGFFYPDPIGFWPEIRKWIAEIVRHEDRSFDSPSALCVGALVHVGARAEWLAAAMELCRPAVVVFLDESAWTSAGWTVKAEPHHVPDPHRDGQVYQGFWGRRDDGLLVAKAPQHPSAHRFYAWDDMADFLRTSHP